MNRIDNYRFYASGIIEHGFTPQGLHWHSQDSQQIRFDQLLSLLPNNVISIVDAGCGFGDLYHYVAQRGDKTIENYIGLDSLDMMVHEASIRTGQTIMQCNILCDPLPEAEYYLCSGALNILTREGAFLFIERCFDASIQGMIFNFLEGDKESKTYNYLREESIRDLARRLKADVVFRRNYYQRDCTAAFYKK